MNHTPHQTERVWSVEASRGYRCIHIVCPLMPGASLADELTVKELQSLFITSETARALVAELNEHLSLIDNPL